MKIEKVKLEWTNKCCGCLSNIPPNNITFMIYGMGGTRDSIHFCVKCAKEIVEECQEEIKNNS